VLVLGQVEVRDGLDSPADHLSDGFATMSSYDYVRFTATARRPDPCAQFRSGSGGR
jgi:hypothetical protein